MHIELGFWGVKNNILSLPEQEIICASFKSSIMGHSHEGELLSQQEEEEEVCSHGRCFSNRITEKIDYCLSYFLFPKSVARAHVLRTVLLDHTYIKHMFLLFGKKECSFDFRV